MKTASLILFSFFCICFLNKAEGQDFEFKGVIKDSLTKESLPFVTLYNLSNNQSVLSNPNGQFLLVCTKGKNVIRITHVGCDPKLVTLFLFRNLDTMLLMAHHQHELTPILITGEKGKLLTLDKDKLSYNDIVLTASKSIGALFDKISGVHSLKTGYAIAKPVIQGMYGSRVSVINNGLKQEGQQWGSEHGLEIDPYNTSVMQLIKGAEALRYSGDAIGGVLLTEPLKFNHSDTLISALIVTGSDNGRSGNLSGVLAKTFTTKMLGQVGLRIQGTVKRGGNLKTPGYYLLNTGILEQNASFAMQIVKTRKTQLDVFTSWFSSKYGILATSHIGNLTDLNKILDGSYEYPEGHFTYEIGRPHQSTQHSLSRIKWVNSFSSTLSSELIYGYQFNRRKEFDSHNYFNKTSPSLDFKLQTHQLDYVLTKTFRDNLSFKTGLNAIFQSNQYEGRYFIPNYLKKDFYQYSILRYKRHRNEFELGYRLGGLQMDAYKWENDLIKEYNLLYKGISWNLGYLFKINHDWQIAINTGKVWRGPNISELFSEGLHHGAAAIEYGNISLKPESALSANFALKYKHNKTAMEAEFFAKKMDNFIYLNPKIPSELTIRGAFPAFVYLQTDAHFFGMDFWLEHQLNRTIAFTEKFSMMNARNTTTQSYINGIPPFRFEHGLLFKIEPGGKVPKLKLNLSALHVLKQKRYTEGTDYQAPPKGYVLFNMLLSSTLNTPKNLDIFLSIDNILNSTYRNYLNRFRYFSDEIGRMTTIGLHFKF